jgi:hypothetical protein
MLHGAASVQQVLKLSIILMVMQGTFQSVANDQLMVEAKTATGKGNTGLVQF